MVLKRPFKICLDSGWPDWATFRQMGDCLHRPVFYYIHNERTFLDIFKIIFSHVSLVHQEKSGNPDRGIVVVGHYELCFLLCPHKCRLCSLCFLGLAPLCRLYVTRTSTKFFSRNEMSLKRNCAIYKLFCLAFRHLGKGKKMERDISPTDTSKSLIHKPLICKLICTRMYIHWCTHVYIHMYVCSLIGMYVRIVPVTGWPNEFVKKSPKMWPK
jgi:hypothetical protein